MRVAGFRVCGFRALGVEGVLQNCVRALRGFHELFCEGLGSKVSQVRVRWL